ncbi:FAD-dependent oxidoreductase [Sphingobium sp. DEHP117]|uniref:FAD-dependent oxidoreductase n=1 Tax=Sphingobium sp. DEHP117 TaxID=2993436 RepID=UPI0027D65F49|nr:FAD-dependent oxidoreductase [Sphingobium sp. DEHP117]MDQ4420357.1 FAD-dependent oxidoreductase [Sphingobium sp. DEHP117]
MEAFDETFDFVVVGSGAGSMAAALMMRSQGKSVVILEKTDLIGGTTARSGGAMWLPNNRFMKQAGIDESDEKAKLYFDAVVGDHNDTPGASRERRHGYIEQSPQLVDFLVGQGVKLQAARYWPDYYDELSGGLAVGRTVVAQLFNVNELGPWRKKLRPGWIPMAVLVEDAFALQHVKQSWRLKRMAAKVGWKMFTAKLTGKQWVTAGEALQGRMLQASLKAGTDIRTDAAVTELIVQDDAVKGVVITRGGIPWRIAGRLGVLVNAGGFSRNQRMRDKYQPGTSVEWTSTCPGDTGEMIEEMMRHGAAVAQMDEMVGSQTAMVPGIGEHDIKPGVHLFTGLPHVIVIDQSGVRYMNESGSYMEYCQHMLERNRTVPAVPSWALFDTNAITRYMLAETLPGARKPKRWFDEGFLVKADDLDEMARRLGMEATTLRNTVERFNGFVDRKVDEDFHRGERSYDRFIGDPFNSPTPTLGKIERAPFYAFRVYPGDVGTYGGVVTDVRARVLKEDGTAIPGLYATGISTASVMGRKYPGAGASVGPSLLWGYVAAKDALGLA